MGLDLSCGDMIIKMGSYSSVHQQRVGMLKAEAKRFKSLGMKAKAAKILQCITNSGDINYRMLKRELKTILHTGVFTFVDDEKEEWMSEDASSILEAINQLRNTFPYIEELQDHLIENIGRKKMYHLEPILQMSVEWNQPIHFF